MATITTTCPSCRLPARLSADEVVLRANHSASAQQALLSFLCHTCEALVSTPVSSAAHDRLVAAGIAEEHIAVSPERGAVRRPFCIDDLLDLHLLLDTPDWFEQLQQPASRAGART